MLFLRYDPSDTSPRWFENREADRVWLGTLLREHLEDGEGRRSGLAACVMGDKGVGKTILVKNVLEGLRHDHSGSNLFVEVDARQCRNQREVLAAISRATVDELRALKAAGAKISDALIDTARLLVDLTHMDSTNVDLSMVHEIAIKYKTALGLSGSQKLLGTLNGDFNISLERTEKSYKALIGKVDLDPTRLSRALEALFRDIIESGLGIVLFLDNIDELRHEQYIEETGRLAVRRDVEGLLLLRNAPIVLLMAMRTYYEGVLPRDISRRRILAAVSATHLSRMLQKRLKDEKPATRELLSTQEAKSRLDRLASRATTPLAFLSWVQGVAQEGGFGELTVDGALRRWLETTYATLPADIIEKVVAAFPAPRVPVRREDVLKACGDNLALLKQVQDRQIVLPQDYWNPTEFYLDPELVFLHPSVRES